MRKISFSSATLHDEEKRIGILTDWHDMGAILGIRTYKLSYAKKFRDKLQEKIVLKQGNESRTVYKSAPVLRFIQSRIMAFLVMLSDRKLSRSTVIGYRKGVSIPKVLQNHVGFKYRIRFDIRKFYDHITRKHIIKTLKTYGFSDLGAKLVSSYCVVHRTVTTKNGTYKLETLQQGSPASPVISNIVGYEFIDKPIEKWIQETTITHPYLSLSYIRYCDNISIGINHRTGGDIPMEFLKEYKQMVKRELVKGKFYTHKWATESQNHPTRNQSFLGIVLNQYARIEHAKFEEWRATLFNACRAGLDIASSNYLMHRNEQAYLDGTVDPTGRFLMVARGRCAYIKHICTKQYLQLTKLLEAAVLLRKSADNYENIAENIPVTNGTMPAVPWDKYILGGIMYGENPYVTMYRRELAHSKMAVLRTYKNIEEPLEDFLDRLKAA